MPIERDTVQDEAKTGDGSSITLRSDTNAVTSVQFLVTHPGVASTPKDICDLAGYNDWAVTDDKRIVSHLVPPQRVIVGHDNRHGQYSAWMGELLGLATTPDHTGRPRSVVRIEDSTKGDANRCSTATSQTIIGPIRTRSTPSLV